MEPLTPEQRTIVAKILGVVEKNFAEVEEVEGYLWKLLDKGTEFEFHETTQIQFPIWSEGYAATGQRSGAVYLGYALGTDFQDACERFARMNPDFEKHFDKERLTYWGCKLFDDEAEARKSFG